MKPGPGALEVAVSITPGGWQPGAEANSSS
jgi:hypothetical protein